MKKLTLNDLLHQITNDLDRRDFIDEKQMTVWGHHSYIKLHPQNENEELQEEVALLLGVSRSPLVSVKQFLAKESIKANIVELSLIEGKKELTVHNKFAWEGIVRETAQIVESSSKLMPIRKVHVFLAAPAALACGVGCILGTVTNPNIYHYVDGTYHLVITAKHCNAS